MQYQNTSKRGRIGLLTPYFASNRGNSTTARRLLFGLEQNGYEVEVFAYNEEAYSEDVRNRLKTCDCLHIIHYYRFAKWLTESQATINLPFIVTSGGTDVNENLFNQSESVIMKDVLFAAEVITVFTEDAKAKLINQFPELEPRIYVIPQSVWIPSGIEASDIPLPEGAPKLLLPAGLRPVKDVLYLKSALLSLKEQFPKLQFVMAGPILDEPTFLEVDEFTSIHSWAHYIGEIPLEKMNQAYEWADYVLNSSISEGQSSALLEAMYMGKVILARSIPGNESLLSDKVNGILYDSPEGFRNELVKLEDDERLRGQIARTARNDVMQKFNLQTEIHAYSRLFARIITRKREY